MNKLIDLLFGRWAPVDGFIRPLFDLGLRLWVAKVFWDAGMTKIQSWDTTLMLFEYEYDVPLLPYELAAYLGTAAELILPILLVLGLMVRPAALALFVFNYIAVISYPDISPAGIKDHLAWGVAIATIALYGVQKLSLDFWINRWREKRIGRDI